MQILTLIFPLLQAVCCSDGLHCCPNGYTCAPGGASCQKSNEPASLIASFQLQEQIRGNGIICPDGHEQCPDNKTCCAITSGGYGCCPYERAVCCEDKIHCCPHGYTCNVALGMCTLSDNSVALKMVQPMVNNVQCADEKTYCPGETTCCKLASGQYGCCPFPKAICCSDGEHCCPNGYTCDIAAGK